MSELKGLHQPAQTAPAVAVQRNHGLDILRIISICGVVAIHVFGLRVGAEPQQGRGWWAAVTIDIAFIWVVPVFVMISGALLLGSRMAVTSPGTFYRQRAMRLIPALIFWNAIYLIGLRIWLRHEDLSLVRILQLLYDGSVYTQLYFLWLILGLYAITPLLAAFVAGKSARRVTSAAAALLAVTVLAFTTSAVVGYFGLARPISLNIFTHWMPYVGYFVAGYALRNIRLRGLSLIAAVGVTVALVASTVWHFGHRGSWALLDSLFPVSYLGASVALSALGVFIVGLSLSELIAVPQRMGRALIALSQASFGVFLVHLVIFEIIRLNVPVVLAADSFRAIAATYVVTLVVSFAVSLLASKTPLLRKVF